ncbi:NAD-dependent epimerase/dehydratase family protein [Peribacillus glennii]|uniref:NAD-dependent epimerase/dehydratase family protein n=1 Tax=Peribacillus glennii TaxID=2303991 RepID=A0A372LF65_9BACI|nr:NAD-dependent epimerase/dehydratase family protein [Peribacillus glennii]RFU64887.1 NAD-dependent epimerase/dehydratase family protein [Peribacillus glennii]
MEKVLVTGGAGFIGSHIVEKLLEEKYEVIVVDDLSSGNKHNLPEGTNFYNININDADLESIFINEKPVYVLHQAAQVSVQESVENPLYDGSVNILGTIHLLQLSVKYSVKKFVFASSAAIYGQPGYLPVDEQHDPKPVSFYGLSKLTAETYIELFSQFFGLSYCILRYSNVYGTRQNVQGEAGVVSIFIDQLLKNQQPKIYGDGNQTRDFIYVEDIASGCVQALSFGNNIVLNLSTNTQTSINQLLEMLLNFSLKDTEPVYLPAKTGDIPHSCLANHEAKNKLNWAPAYSLQKGILKTLDYFRK